MKTVILAGGKGTRLRPYTTVFPKPLMPIGERPILDIVIDQLRRYGFYDIILSVGYLSELIEAYFQNTNGRFSDINMTYVREKSPMGTAGSLSNIDGLDETFMVMNGDLLTTLDYTDLLNYHKERGGILTIGTYKKEVKIDLGVIEAGLDGVLTGYIEKPTNAYSVSMGVYIYEPEVLNYIMPNEYIDFPDLVLRLLKHSKRVIAYPFEGYWLDIGRHEDYVQAQGEFEQFEELFLPKSSVFI